LIELAIGRSDVLGVPLRIPHLDDLASADEDDFSLDPGQLREARRDREAALAVDRGLDRVLHELKKESSLFGVRARLLAVESLDHPAPRVLRIEEEAGTDATGDDERLAGLAVPEASGKTDAALLVDSMGVLAEVRDRRSAN
jgi:hypothetical protein